MTQQDLDIELKKIISQYAGSFSDKAYGEENNDHDLLMDIFNITPEIKRENRQYWGRELGMCWQLLIDRLCELKCADYLPAIKVEADEPTDMFVGKDAIDTKYRIGSGDSGTLKKFKQYGAMLKGQGFRPVLLILREDNLPAALGACRVGGWTLYVGPDAFAYIKEKTSFDLEQYLKKLKGSFTVQR